MKISRPDFMQLKASDKLHPASLDVLIGLVIMLISSFAMSFVYAPIMMMYIMNDSSYVKMAKSGNFDYTKVMKIIANLPEWMTIVTLISEIVLIFGCILYCTQMEKRTVASMGFVKKGIIKNVFAGILIGAASISFSVLIMVLTGTVTITGLSSKCIPVYIIFYFIGYLIQGTAEETLCRGYLMVTLSRKYSMVTAVIVSSAFFSILHIMNASFSFLAFVNIFLVGVLFALIMIDSGNIWIAGAAHGIWNFCEGNLYNFSVSGLAEQNSILGVTVKSKYNYMKLINGSDFGPEGGIAVTIALIVTIVLVGIKMHKSKKILFGVKEEVNTYQEGMDNATEENNAKNTTVDNENTTNNYFMNNASDKKSEEVYGESKQDNTTTNNNCDNSNKTSSTGNGQYFTNPGSVVNIYTLNSESNNEFNNKINNEKSNNKTKTPFDASYFNSEDKSDEE